MRLPRLITSFSALNRATLSTQNDLYQTGFWMESTRLIKTEIFWCAHPVPTNWDAEGVFYHGTDARDEFFGFQRGHIYIPGWSLSHLAYWRHTTAIRDIVRHEYGHAVAHHYPKLIRRSDKFRDAFGGTYDDDEFPEEWDGDFVSDYAKTDPSEDFADTFMLYLKHRGKIPQKYKTPSILRKWRFIRDLGKVVRAGGSNW